MTKLRDMEHGFSGKAYRRRRDLSIADGLQQTLVNNDTNLDDVLDLAKTLSIEPKIMKALKEEVKLIKTLRKRRKKNE